YTSTILLTRSCPPCRGVPTGYVHNTKIFISNYPTKISQSRRVLLCATALLSPPDSLCPGSPAHEMTPWRMLCPAHNSELRETERTESGEPRRKFINPYRRWAEPYFQIG